MVLFLYNYYNIGYLVHTVISMEQYLINALY